MFPVVGEFNIVVAGIATFAATVGYACSRRLSSSSSTSDTEEIRQALMNGSNSSESEQKKMPQDHTMSQEQKPNNTPADVLVKPTIPTEDSTSPVRRYSFKLKRKIPHDGFDEPEKEILGYPHNLANIYPNKRSRTPSMDSEATQSTTPIVPVAPLEHIVSPEREIIDQDMEISVVPSEDSVVIIATPAPEPPRTPSPAPEEACPKPASPAQSTTSLENETSILQPTQMENTATLPSVVEAAQPVSPFRSFVSTSLPATPRFGTLKPIAFSTPQATGGFAAFAGSSSPFATFNSTAFTSSSTSRKLNSANASAFKSTSKSIWSSGGDLKIRQNGDDDEGEPPDLLSEALKPLKEKSKERESIHAIGEATATSLHPTEKYTNVTGEEDEDVELEQKGVKLYIKRGDKPFIDGTIGHIKLLKNRTTKEERILFRREPLWKVSMNIRVKSSVRCTYVPEENVVRLILKEAVDAPALADSSSELESLKTEVVIYALKPGRSCSKQDFKDFAEALMENSHFQQASGTTLKTEDKSAP